jgi:hypothetical protein
LFFRFVEEHHKTHLVVMSILHEGDVLAAQIIAANALLGLPERQSIEQVKAQYGDASQLQHKLRVVPAAVKILPREVSEEVLGFRSFVETSVLVPFLLQGLAVVFKKQGEVHVLVAPLPTETSRAAPAIVLHSYSKQEGDVEAITISQVQRQGFLRASIAFANIMRRNNKEDQLRESETKEVLSVLRLEGAAHAAPANVVISTPMAPKSITRQVPTAIPKRTTAATHPFPSPAATKAATTPTTAAAAVPQPLTDAPLQALAYTLLAAIQEDPVPQQERVTKCLDEWQEVSDGAEELMAIDRLPKPNGNGARPLTAIINDSARELKFPVVIAATRAGYQESLPGTQTILAAYNGTSIVVLEAWPIRGAPRLRVFDESTHESEVDDFAGGQRTLPVQKLFVAVRAFRNLNDGDAAAMEDTAAAAPAQSVPLHDSATVAQQVQLTEVPAVECENGVHRGTGCGTNASPSPTQKGPPQIDEETEQLRELQNENSQLLSRINRSEGDLRNQVSEILALDKVLSWHVRHQERSLADAARRKQEEELERNRLVLKQELDNVEIARTKLTVDVETAKSELFRLQLRFTERNIEWPCSTRNATGDSVGS